VEVKLRLDGADLIMEVADNGGGFEPHSAEEGTGLSSLRQRAARLGGSCLVDSRPGAGTRVSIRIPLQERGHRSRPLPPPPLGQEPAA
jgi:signal transduction histidine kinase